VTTTEKDSGAIHFKWSHLQSQVLSINLGFQKAIVLLLLATIGMIELLRWLGQNSNLCLSQNTLGIYIPSLIYQNHFSFLF
jgi:hypothetical protein